MSQENVEVVRKLYEAQGSEVYELLDPHVVWINYAAAPEATETIAYSMPALRSHGGQFLVSYAAYKKHYSLFPASGDVVAALGDELTPYLAGKGTIQFPAAQAIPLSLVTKIVKIRFAENAERAAGAAER